MAPPKPKRKSRNIHLDLYASEWDPLFAYAESQGLTPSQAARELLLTSLSNSVSDAVYIAAARAARHSITKIAYAAGARAMRMAQEEIQARAIAMGVPFDDLG